MLILFHRPNQRHRIQTIRVECESLAHIAPELATCFVEGEKSSSWGSCHGGGPYRRLPLYISSGLFDDTPARWSVAPLRCTTSVMRWIALLPLRGLMCTSLDEKRGVWQKRETLLGKSTPFSAPNG